MINARTKTFAWIMTFLGIAAVAGALVFFFRPNWIAAVAQTKEIIKANAELNAQYLGRKELLSNAATVRERSATVAKLADQLVVPGNELDFITEIESLSDKNGLQHSVRISDASGAPRAEFTKSVEITFEGKYSDVMSMLADLDRTRFLLVPAAVELHPTSPEPGKEATTYALYRGFLAFRPEKL